MSEKAISLPVTGKDAERKIAVHPHLASGHWRLQKALDILLNYLIELERNSRGDEEAENPEDDNQLLF